MFFVKRTSLWVENSLRETSSDEGGVNHPSGKCENVLQKPKSELERSEGTAVMHAPPVTVCTLPSKKGDFLSGW